MSNACSFLAQVDQLEEEAQGVRDLIRFAHRELVEQGAFGFETDPIAMTARSAGQPADLVQMMKHHLTRLFTDDCVQTRRYMLDILC